MAEKHATRYALLLAGALLLLIAGCTQPGANSLNPPASPATPEEIAAIVEGNNRFALDFFQQVKDEKGNLFFSPYSISTALAMTYEGARSQTAQEMAGVFGLPEEDAVRHRAFANQIFSLNQPNEDYKLSVANALWIQQDFPVLESFVSTVQTHYYAEARNVDFVGAAEEARQTINAWVEAHTNNLIKDLIPKGVLDASTRLVLTNAIHFKGAWVTEFDSDLTQDSDFRLSGKQTVQAPLMRHKGETDFKFAETENVKVLEMPYKGGRLSMLAVLPKDRPLSEVEGMLSLEKLQEWKGLMREQEVRVVFPRFKMEKMFTLSDALSEMGMPTAFTDAADLSGINGTRDLFITAVLHKAFVEVNEEGTEAAAATAVVIGVTSAGPPPATFIADRPFLFFIQDNESGAILFMGRVADPR